jgi:manganese oxidase
MHCHMTHHTMNQMGHNAPNLIGVRAGDLDKRVSTFLRGYMTMGESGMADMGQMSMKVPRNSIPMVGAPGKHDYIDMGGMFTVVKVRENLTSYDDPGWYENPPGTLASLASNDELQRDLGKIPETKPMDNNMKMDHGNMGHMRMLNGG